ncbi:MAG TPA: D-alanyl-D-alanine carboxypeptidase/D-alanyl-D-alanine-endopeptidase, partial [Gemmatimonadaceae bacterium]|nr:D-alanyl-D-alanine carboxypeptidase/D-alanyl-D-alanine-endopeptidase [Gemmatimonadaceae bacterium]
MSALSSPIHVRRFDLRRTLVALAAAGTVACSHQTTVATGPRPVTGRSALQVSADSLIGEAMWRNTNWGLLVVDPIAHDTLYSHNAGKLFMPASNEKLLTGSTALAQLGPDFRFSTAIMSSAPISGGVIRGDLIAVGRGDPSMSDAMMGDAMKPLRAIADSLYAHGLREVTGALRKGGNAFPDTTIGPWDWDNLETTSGAAIDELFFNQGVARVTVYGGDHLGDPVRIKDAPSKDAIAIVADFVTSNAPPAGEGGRGGRGGAGGGRGGRGNAGGAIRGMTDLRGAEPVVHLTGWVGPHDSATTQIAIRDPASAWLHAFAEALSDRGIKIDGGIIRTPDVVIAEQQTLTTLSSPTLAEIFPHFFKPSQNQIGEILLRTLGLERAHMGTQAAGARIVEQQMVQFGADTAGFAVRDGSGLSRHDYVTPETIVKLLDAMRVRPDFKVFYDAMPIGGVDGTIANRMKGTPAQGNVHAKTGTVDKSHALSGYVTTSDGHMLLFSFQCNNYTV